MVIAKSWVALALSCFAAWKCSNYLEAIDTISTTSFIRMNSNIS